MVKINRELLAGATRIRRMRAKMDQATLARSLGYSPSTLCRLETGAHDPSAAFLLSVCAWMGRNPMDFAIDEAPS